MIKTLLFDNNGVLTTTEYEGVVKLAKIFGVEYRAFNEIWKECAKPLDHGEITTKEFFLSLLNRFNSKVEIDIVKEIYFSCYERDDKMHKIVKNLAKQYNVALLSNFGEAFEIFEKRWRTSETIKPENIFVSVKLGMRKPHADIYEYVLAKMGAKPHETVFIDDRIENIEAAKGLRIHGIVFKNKDQFLADLDRIVC